MLGPGSDERAGTTDVEAILVLYIVGEILTSFGTLCVDSKGEKYCGVGDYSGGLAMIIIGAFFLVLATAMVRIPLANCARAHRLLRIAGVPH
jgi:hypothetical protein